MVVNTVVVFGALCVLLLATWWFRANRLVEHAEFASPDGRFKVVVMRQRSLLGSMPGQTGDSPGEVQLQDYAGQVLQRQPLQMVQLVDRVEWQPTKASIKLVAEWSLPP